MDKAKKTRMLIESFNNYAKNINEDFNEDEIEYDNYDNIKNLEKYRGNYTDHLIDGLQLFAEQIKLQIAPKFKESFSSVKYLSEKINKFVKSLGNDIYYGKVTKKDIYESNSIIENAESIYANFDAYGVKDYDGDIKKWYKYLLKFVQLGRILTNNKLFSDTKIIEDLKNKLK